MLVELTTPEGWKFWAESFVHIGEEDIPLDSLTEQQRNYVMASVDVHALNAVYAGRATFKAEGLPEFEEVFPELAEKLGRKKKTE